MDRESDPSYLEWVRLKGSSTGSAGQDVVDLASSLIERLYERLSSAEALQEASSREFDQKVHRLERAAQTHQQATQNALFELNQSQSQCQTLQESLNVCRTQIASLTTSKSELEDRLAAAARAQEMSEARLRDQLPLQERRALQMASQTEQLKSLKDELQISNQERLRLETQVANLQSSALSVNYELTLAKTETENLRRQLEQLHADSRDKASHWREEKASLTREKHDLERQLQSASDDLLSAQAQANFSAKAVEEKEKALKRLQAQLDSLQVGQRAFNESAKNSQFAQLAELYKNKLDESEAQRERLRSELSKRTDEVQVKSQENKQLKDQNLALQTEVENLQIQVANLAEGSPQSLTLSKDKLLSLLRGIIDNSGSPQARMEIDTSTSSATVPSTSPSASNTTNASLDSTEITKILEKAATSENLHQLIDLQRKYEVATAQLVKQRAENRQLEEYFVRIESELARTEPLMEENRRKHDSAIAELEAVKTQLATTSRSLQQRETEVASQQRKISSLQQQVRQTSTQIQTLLHQQQSAGSAAVNSLADIASLHNRNVELEILTRDLQSTVQELQQERDAHIAEIEHLNDRYQQMEATISSLEAAISAQEEIHAMSARKRSTTQGARRSLSEDAAEDEQEDSTVQRLLFDESIEDTPTEETDTVGSNIKPNKRKSLTPFSVEESPKYQHALSQIDELRQLVNDISTERDKWRDSASKLQSSLSLRESELERSQNRISTLQSTHKVHEEQIEDMRNKISRQTAIVEKYETEVAELASSRNTAVMQATQATQMLEVNKLQIQLLKEQLEQQSLALAQSREQWQSQQAHFRESSALHAQQESHWVDVTSQYEARVAQLQELLDATNQDTEEKLRATQDTLSTLRAEQASATSKIAHLEEIVALKDQSLNQLKELLEEQRAIMETLKRSASRGSAPAPSEPIPTSSQSNEELSDLQRKFDEQKEELNITSEHLANSKSLLAQTETRLNQLQAQYNNLAEEMRSTLSEYEGDIEKLQSTLKARSESETMIRESFESLTSEHGALVSEHAALKIQFSARDTEIDGLRDHVTQLKSDNQALEETLRSTRINYQHQVTELGNALSQLETLQKRTEKVTSERDSLLAKLETTQQNLLAAKSQSEAKNSAHASEVALLQQRIQDGMTNITAMTSEITMLKSQINYWKTLGGGAAALATPADADSSAAINLSLHADAGDATVADSADDRTYKWVKREYEIAVTQLALAQQENSEQRAQIQVLRETNDRLTSEIKALREDSSDTGGAESSRNLSFQQQQMYEKLQAQTEQLNLLKESNTMLRLQKNAEEKERRELEEKFITVSQDKENLQSMVTRLSHEKSALLENVQVLTQQNESWSGRVHELLTKYKDIETHATQESRILELEKTLAAVSSDREEIQARLEDYESQRAEADSRTYEATLEKQQIQEKLEMIQRTLETRDTELASANETITSLNGDLDEYKEQLEEYVGEVANLTATVDKLEADLAESKKKAAAAPAKVAPIVPAKQTASTAAAATPSAAKTVAPAMPKTAPPPAPTPMVSTPATAASTSTSMQVSEPTTPVPAPTTAASAKLPPPPKSAAKIPPPPSANAAPVVAAAAAPPPPPTIATPPPVRATAPAPPKVPATAKVSAATATTAPTESAATAAPAAPKTAPVAPPKAPASKLPPPPPIAAMKSHLTALESRLDLLESAKATKLQQQQQEQQQEQERQAQLQAEAQAKAQEQANAMHVTAEETPTAKSTSAARPPPPAPKRNLPPPPPPAPKNGKRSFAQMSADAPAYVPSSASVPIASLPQETQAALSVSTPVEPEITNSVTVRQPPSETHTEAPPSKRPRLADTPIPAESAVSITSHSPITSVSPAPSTPIPEVVSSPQVEESNAQEVTETGNHMEVTPETGEPAEEPSGEIEETTNEPSAETEDIMAVDEPVAEQEEEEVNPEIDHEEPSETHEPDVELTSEPHEEEEVSSTAPEETQAEEVEGSEEHGEEEAEAEPEGEPDEAHEDNGMEASHDEESVPHGEEEYQAEDGHETSENQEQEESPFQEDAGEEHNEESHGMDAEDMEQAATDEQVFPTTDDDWDNV